MGANSQLVDGKLTLARQQDTLNFMEQVTASKVITYGKSAQQAGDLKVNEAVLIPVPFGQQPPPLELVSAASDADAANLISKQLGNGKAVVFHEKAWVDGKETTVLGFRKSS